MLVCPLPSATPGMQAGALVTVAKGIKSLCKVEGKYRKTSFILPYCLLSCSRFLSILALLCTAKIDVLYFGEKFY